MESIVGQSPVMDWQSHDLDSAWKAFKTHVEFMFNGPLKEKDEPQRCAYLMLWVGEKGRNIFSTWDITDEEKKVIKNYFDRFEQYVKPRSNIIYNRYKFQSRVQQEGETFEQFVTELQVLVKDCDFRDRDEMVRDRIVFGIKNSKVREKLINMDLIARIYSVVSDKKSCKIPEDIVAEYSEVFKGIGCIPGEHHINVDLKFTPVVHPPRKVPIALKARVKKRA